MTRTLNLAILPGLHTGPAEPDRIEIVGRSVSGWMARGAVRLVGGILATPPSVFVVRLVRDDGGCSTLWSGSDYARAGVEAERCAVAWRVPVLDRVIE